ncbi:TIGR03032 family protein [Bradyrhizobium sp. STM 3562]|uniref:TIGR03032 family protein n=1 Tax=Bradyrhizobium sp. STM 3562 TaxID=578924 RepID=UPI00388CF92E
MNHASNAPGRRRVNQAEAIDYQVTPSFVALLEKLGCSLVITNYQSSTVMTFSSLGDGRPVQMFAAFQAAMGLALAGDRLAVAALSEVIVLTNIRKLAPSLPKFPGIFDGYFVPRVHYTTGECSLHDMVFDASGGLLAVNTAYSCICRIDGIHNFVPVWQPPWISEVRPGDRCHLNGMAVENGEVRYATALGTTDVPRDWTERRLDGGVLVEVPSGRVLADGLCMPHSARLVDGRLYMIEAGTGTLLEVDRVSGARRPIVTLPGFARGLAVHEGYLFIGLSLMRDSKPFEGLPVERIGRELICGLVAVEIASGQVIGTLRYIGGCTEIHDIQVVPGVRRLGISGYDSDTHKLAIDLPELGLWLDPPPDDSQHLKSAMGAPAGAVARR